MKGTKYEVGSTKYFGEYGAGLYIIGAYLGGVARIYSPPKNAARTGESDAGRELNQLSIVNYFLRRRATSAASARRLSVLVVGSGTFRPVMVITVPTLPVL